MNKHHLHNYLRTERRRRGLRQHHIAYFLGGRSGTKISRYERFGRVPDLPTVFALEAIYGLPASKLFAGICDEAKSRVEARAMHALTGADPALASLARRILDPARSRPPESSPTLS